MGLKMYMKMSAAPWHTL